MNILHNIKVGITWVLLTMLLPIFGLINCAYQIFLILSEVNIFEQSDYQGLTEKIYVILGVIMMFVIAYNLLTLIVDPDKNKGGETFEKLFKNLVTSFIMIVLCPSLFSFAFKVQNSILNSGVINKFFDISGTTESFTNSVQSGGRQMALHTFSAFFKANNVSGTTTEDVDSQIKAQGDCSGYTLNGSTLSKNCTLLEAKNYALESGDWFIFHKFAGNVADDEISFDFPVALIARAFLCYVIISYVFDMTVRIIKLALYQIIAPITISCRILPNQEGIFKNWWKAVSKTFLSVFIRIFIMDLGIFLLSYIVRPYFIENIFKSAWGTCNAGSSCNIACYVLLMPFLILGLGYFLKQAPKLIDEIFNLGDVKLGIADKFKEGISPYTSLASGVGGFMASTMTYDDVNKRWKFTMPKNPFQFVEGFGQGVLGATRAAIQGFQKSDLSGIHAESKRHLDYLVQRGNGVTRRQMLEEYVRRKVGLPTRQEAEDMRLEYIEEFHDKTGKEYVTYGAVARRDENGNYERDAAGNIRYNLAIVDSTGEVLYDSGREILGEDTEEYKLADSMSRVAYGVKLKNEFEERTTELNQKSKNYDDQIRRIQQFSQAADKSNSHVKDAMAIAEKKVTAAKKDEIINNIRINGTDVDKNGNQLIQLSLSTGQNYMFNGALQAMESNIAEILKKGEYDGKKLTSDDMAKLQGRLSLVKERLLFKYINAAMDKTNALGIREEGIVTQVTQVIDDITSGKFKNTDGSAKTWVDGNGNKTVINSDWIRTYTDKGQYAEMLDAIKDVRNSISGEADIKINKISRSKDAVETQIKNIEEVNRLYADEVALRKNTKEYREMTASNKYRASHQNEIKPGGDSSGGSSSSSS